MGQTVKSKLWEGKNAGGSGGSGGGDGTSSTGPIITPGGGGTITTAQLISGNFGPWTSLTGRTNEFIDTIELKFKSDLQAFATRSITYLQGQFSLNAAFAGTSLLLGTIGDNNSFPVALIQKYIIVANVEMFLEVDTAGNISLVSKDGLNLPVNNAGEPYYIDTFWHPGVAYTPLPTYTSHRTQNFTPNCGAGHVAAGTVAFTKDYTSTISQDAADALAASDGTYAAAGQAYADAHGTCLVVYTAIRTENFTRDDCGYQGVGSLVPFTRTYTSIISQADANAQAAGDGTFEAAGQTNADTLGTCLYTCPKIEGFYRDNCPTGYEGTGLDYSENYYSAVSYIDAFNAAEADSSNFEERGQAYVNDSDNGAYCHLPFNITIANNSATEDIAIINCIKDGGPTTTFNNILPTNVEEDHLNPGTYTVSVKTSATANYLGTTVNGVTKDNTDGFNVHSFYPVSLPITITIQDV